MADNGYARYSGLGSGGGAGTVTSVTASSPLFSSGGSTPNLTIQQATTSQNGFLSSIDWNTFNNKQPAGSYITALTGDATASGPGSAVLTLATVNANVGTFASVTVNGKGLVTAASALSGDVTTSGSVLTLNTVNANVGSFTNANITVNAKGLITAAANGSSGSGSVTSVALADGSTTPIYTITGSPVTTSGTLTETLRTQNANLVFAGPTTGAAVQPSFRALVNADLPSGTSAFAAYASSAITGSSSAITGSGFQTFSNSPAFTITPTITGTYKVYSSVPISSQNNSSGVLTRIFNTSGSATLLQESQALSYINTGNTIDSVEMQSVYSLTAGTTYVFDIQANPQGSGSTFINNGLAASFYMFAEGIGLATASFTTMGAFGSSPNANAGTISGNVLTLQPASASFPGGVSTTTQTFAGSKTLGANASDATVIGTTASTAIQTINGGLQQTTRTITANLTIDTTTTDSIILCNQSGAITVTLPTPTNGRTITIKDISGTASTNNITIARHAAEQIEGIAASKIIQGNYDSETLVSDGTNWWML